MDPLDSNIWIVVPAYNESKNIGFVLDAIKNYTTNIVVVDDGSKDTTAIVALSCAVAVIQHIINLGKGAALKTGCDYALQNGAKKIIVIDADGQHNPYLIPLFAEKLELTEIIFGYRKLSKAMPFVLRFGNWFISKITYLLYGVNLEDTQCGYRAFTADTYRKIRWESQDYGMESEMITQVGKWKLPYATIPVETVYQDKYKGTTIFDGVKIVLKLIRWRLM